ncbi:hypothetical protein ABIF07_001030 [Bradyrhizobium elkanii]|uniref:hypothetical protein n=1 Tax=Bradyrhizobium elkanii TaxID=29448 RepID=UPI002168E62E|nr:hypothetical protein [Bradyrhizobium elkanii]MCS3692054.1 hypothetical protein [Bradyrhizobium elkanii]
MRHPIETLWREVGLPEYFLGNDGSNTKLYALYDAILARSSERIVDASAIRPYTWAYRYHDCVRFNGGEQVNGSRPQGSFPLFDQKAIDMAVAAERERCAKIAEPKGPRPCDCEYGACYCRNAGDAAAVASWDADMAVARAIRAPVSGSTEGGK